MDANVIEEMRTALETEKAELEKELKGLGSEKPGPDAEFKDRGDDEDVNAQEVSEFQDDLSLEASLETTHGEVKAALERISDGTFGVCENCEKEITLDRIKALPRATHCIECEKGE